MPYVILRYERVKLNQEVWTEAVTIVAKRYGISDVALRKICKKLAVPLPPLGHWARVSAGKKLPTPPLPKHSGPAEIVRQKLRLGLQEHTHRFLQDKYDHELHGHDGLQKILEHWEEKVKASNDDRINKKTTPLFLEMLESQRKYLSDLNKDDGIDEEIIRWQIYQIDLEEERLKML